ncbi:MAG: hypothetical protein QNJ97_21330 [Myxococcota bacterium]|nr:hypothetical protein [Myxococcota bacterium]
MIHFRTRGGPFQGWGNVHRLASFAQLCRERGLTGLRFFVEGPPEIQTFLQDKQFETIALKEDISLDQEAAVFSRYPSADVIVMEMLECHYDRQKMLKEHCDMLVVFDDLLDHYYCADWVVCGQLLPNYANIELSDPSVRLLSGLEYFLCRPHFLEYPKRSRRYSKAIDNVLVMFGGGRYDVAYLKVARAIADRLPDVNSTFILGHGNMDHLANKISAVLPNAELIGGVGDIQKRLWECDLAFVSGGYSKLEAAITQTPAVVVATQWHQMPLVEQFCAAYPMVNMGYMGFMQLETIKQAIDGLALCNAREQSGQGCAQAIDGKGMSRVFDAVFGQNSIDRLDTRVPE